MGVNRVKVGCIWFDSSWFLKYSRFQVLSSFPPESSDMWMIEKLEFSIFWISLSFERGGDYKINDPNHMNVWWLFSEIWLFKIFTSTFSWSWVPPTMIKIFWVSQIWYHSIEMETCRMMMSCIWFNRAWFSRYLN